MSQTQVYTAQKSEIMPSKRAYLARAGFKGEKVILEDRLRDVANSVYAVGLDLAKGVITYANFPIDELTAEVIPESFGGAKAVTFFASTLGQELDEQIEQFSMAEQVLHATLLDAWGSEALEALNRFFDGEMRQKYGRGTRRFSPGYGDVDIRANSLILDLIRCDTICANVAGLLLPRKSTVCMIGWFDGQ